MAEETGAKVHQHVEVKTGEEGEVVLYKQRSRLYRFDKDVNEWKERGTGDVKLLYHPETRKVRILLREEKTMKLRLNHSIVTGLVLQQNMGSDRAWSWASTDFSEPDPAVHLFTIRFKDADVANTFKAKFVEAQEIADGKRAPPALDQLSKADEDSKAGNPWDRVIHDGKLVAGVNEERLGELWAKYDREGAKTIDGSDLEPLLADLVRAVVRACKEPLPENFEEGLLSQVADVTQKVLKQLDAEVSSKISWDDFKALQEVSLV